jgi:hypothetical protein
MVNDTKMAAIRAALDEMCRMFTMCAPSNSVTEARFDAASVTATAELTKLQAELAAKDKALEIADGLASSVCRAYSAGLVSGNIRDQATAYRAARGAK